MKSSGKSPLTRIGRQLAGLIYPDLCPVCGQRLADGERVICVPCRWEVPATEFWLDPLNPVFALLHGGIPELQEASSLFFFHHRSHYRRAIHLLKYNGRRDIARALGEWFGRELKESGLYDGVTLLIPVPLHWTKRIARGYNQAEEICRGMSRGLGVPVDFRSLRRIRRTRTQAFRPSAEARRKNVEGAFAVRRGRAPKLAGEHILLVDDVLTTGSTLIACADAIRRVLPDTPVAIGAATLSAVRPKT